MEGRSADAQPHILLNQLIALEVEGDINQEMICGLDFYPGESGEKTVFYKIGDNRG